MSRMLELVLRATGWDPLEPRSHVIAYDPSRHHDVIPSVYAESFDDEPWPEDWDRFEEFDPGGMFVTTVEGDAVPAGYVISFPRRGFGYISVVAVRPAHRRRGLATELLATAVGYLRSRGLTEIRIHVDAENHAAVRAYEKFGFEYLSESRDDDPADTSSRRHARGN